MIAVIHKMNQSPAIGIVISYLRAAKSQVLLPVAGNSWRTGEVGRWFAGITDNMHSHDCIGVKMRAVIASDCSAHTVPAEDNMPGGGGGLSNEGADEFKARGRKEIGQF